MVIVPTVGHEALATKLPEVLIGVRLLQLATGANNWALFIAFVSLYSTVVSSSLGAVNHVAGAGGFTFTVV